VKGELMKRILVVAALLVFFMTGCSELKQLRIETADQKLKIAQLNKENQSCQEALKQSNDLLKDKVGELETRMSELKAKDMKAQEQNDAFTKMQEAMKAELAS
jgi:septal ring factor EnvC (AmiA/AmiB activator)